MKREKQFWPHNMLLRRVYAAQKDDNGMPPIEAIIAPLEAELNLACTSQLHDISLCNLNARSNFTVEDQ